MTAKNPGAKPNPSDPATVIRQAAAEQLSAQLSLSTAMLAQCNKWVEEGKSDRNQSVTAAARLMLAGAGLTRSLTLAALGETRHRSIVEQPSPADRAKEERQAFYGNNLHAAEVRQRFTKRLDEIVEQSVRARMGEAGVQDRVADILKDEQTAIDNLKKKLAEDD